MAASKSAKSAASSHSSRKTASPSTPRASNGTKSVTRKTTKLGRSRIPVDAPLDVVFEEDAEARSAFSYLGINTIRELQKLGPDELIIRLTSPTKQTVGRIRKMLALNNRCLDGDERFALDIQKQKK